MTDATPVLPSQSKTKHRSIKSKFLIALLALSLLPLILFMAISRLGITYVQDRLRSDLVETARLNLAQLAKDQAAVVSAKLEHVAKETRTAASLVQSLEADPSVLGGARSGCTAEKPDNPDAACSFTLAPGTSMAAAQPVLDLSRSLEKVFASIKGADPSLKSIYYGTRSGVYLEYPWQNETMDTFAFTLEPALAQDLSRNGEITEKISRAFRENGLAVSSHSMVSTTDAGNRWLIRDDEKNWIFSVRRDNSSPGNLGVYWEYDPRGDPWYKNAVGRDRVAWTKYDNWVGAQALFELKPGIESRIPDKVSPTLARAFADRRITLIENSPISILQNGKWRLRDNDDIYYEIRDENGKLRVYNVDLLTASQPVLDAEGRLAGVVGLDIGTHSVGENIAEIPDAVPGSVFLLDDGGKLIAREKDDMFIPKVGGAIRSHMAAGNPGIEYAPDGAAEVAYAPIRSIGSPDGKSFWSVGISMPEAAITKLADATRQRMVNLLRLGVGIIIAAMIIPVVFAAVRIAKGITGPIEDLGAGVMRIGGGDLDYRLDVRTHDEIEQLANAFNKMAGDLQAYIRDLAETTAEKERTIAEKKRTEADKERTEKELREAHDLQMSFLKKIFPAFPHRADFSLNAAIMPARQVGGDLYDFALLDDSRLFFYVGDVSDKGVPAALIMAVTMRLMKLASLQPGITPAGILKQVNVTLVEGNESGFFVTLFVGILNLATGELAFSNAGHNPPVILSADGDCTFLTLPDGLVLGVMPDIEYRDATIVLERGAMFVAYTDGVTEAMNPKEELYSERRLQETVAGLKGRSVEDTVAAIFASVKAHASGAPQSDDIAVLAVRRN